MRLIVPVLFCFAMSSALSAQAANYWTFGLGCAGSMAATHLTALARPVLGSALRVDLDNLPVNAAVMLTGVSYTNSPMGPLPLALDAYGMPGCLLRVRPDVTTLVLGTGNHAVFVFAVPPLPGLIGVQFFQQSLVFDAGAGNTAGAVASDAAVAWVGLNTWPSGGTPVANMVPIAAGSFRMGSGAFIYQYPWTYLELPVHTVTITHPFWMGRYEVTQAEYQALMPSNWSHFRGPNLPVEQVSWNEAVAYCTALTAQEVAANRVPAGYEYRLPTEAEWESCCRAGTTTEFNVGSTLNCSQANFRDENTQTYCVGQTSAVGSYAPNAWGLYDMHGNVSEWCLDSWYGYPNYPAGPVMDPFVPSSVSGPNRVRRGGFWDSDSYLSRSASRFWMYPGYRFSDMGFRVVLAPVLVP